MSEGKMQKFLMNYELADGTTGTVRVLNRSLIAWDETRAKRKWPTAEEGASLWQTFIVWHALTRSGQYTGDFDTFKETDCVQVEMDDDDDAEEVPPTQTAAAPMPSYD